MIEGLVDPLTENFQNPNSLDEHFNEIGAEDNEYQEVVRANNKPIISVDSEYNESPGDNNPIVKFNEEGDVDSEEEVIDQEFSDKFRKESFLDEKKKAERDSEYEKLVLKDIDDERDEEDGDVVEGFNGGQFRVYLDNKLLLKSILFGLLFYILANPRSYKYTSRFTTNKLDRVLVHAIIFTLLVYLVNQVV